MLSSLVDVMDLLISKRMIVHVVFVYVFEVVKKAIDQFYRRYSAITTGNVRGRGGYLPQDYGIGDIKNQRAP